MKSFTGWLKDHKIHIIGWVLFIAYECTVVRVFNGVNGHPLAYLLHYSIIITTFYVHALVSMPWALQNRLSAIWKLPCVVALEIVAYTLLYYLSDVLLQFIHVKVIDGAVHLNSVYFVFNIYRAVYFLGFSTAYYFLTNYIGERRKTELLEKERLYETIQRQKIEQELTHAQNAFLKAQINPHFLFNTLDFVYHNVSELSPQAADAIITLSEMMRFAIDADKMGEFILIGDEIEQVQNLQYLNRLRKNDAMPLRLSYPEEVRNVNFIPLVLLTLAENIFKHGSLQHGEEAMMEIYLEKGWLVIQTDNLSSRQRPGASHRTGLINIEQRLKYAYGDRVYFHHQQDADGHFRLTIKVPVGQLHDISAPSPAFVNIGTV